MNAFKKQAVFGAADGVTAIIGLIAPLASQPHALFKAAVGVGLAELVGMTAGAWLSADEDASFWQALTNGGASCAAIIVPAWPFLLCSGWAALFLAVLWIIYIGAVIAWLRPEHGIKAIAETFGVLAIAAIICYAAALI